MRILDSTFMRHPRPYIVQSLLALVFAAVILVFVESVTHAVIVAALGSGAICCFGIPRGTFGSVADTSDVAIWVVGAVAIGLAVFVMTTTDTEHPPAAATALGIAIHGWSGATVAFVLGFAVCLAVARWALGKRLVDLY